MIHVSDPSPLGDVTLVPQQISGHSEADLASAMADALAQAEPQSGSEALRLLRAMFPDSPLTVRVAALGALMRH
jgi:hypothetical protein